MFHDIIWLCLVHSTSSGGHSVTNTCSVVLCHHPYHIHDNNYQCWCWFQYIQKHHKKDTDQRRRAAQNTVENVKESRHQLRIQDEKFLEMTDEGVKLMLPHIIILMVKLLHMATCTCTTCTYATCTCATSSTCILPIRNYGMRLLITQHCQVLAPHKWSISTSKSHEIIHHISMAYVCLLMVLSSGHL